MKLKIPLAAVASFAEWWKRVARKIGDVQARVILTLFYFIVIGPFALPIRWWGDPLTIKARTPRGWRLRENDAGNPMERATKQF